MLSIFVVKQFHLFFLDFFDDLTNFALSLIDFSTFNCILSIANKTVLVFKPIQADKVDGVIVTPPHPGQHAEFGITSFVTPCSYAI